LYPGLDHKRVAFPFTERIAHVVGLEIVGIGPAIGPDFTPIAVILEVLQDAILGVDNFEGARSEKIPRNAVGIATGDVPRGDEFLVGFIGRSARGREGRKRIRVAAKVEWIYFALGLHVGSGIPDAGEIVRIELPSLSIGGLCF
jgi:hypothetical protein